MDVVTWTPDKVEQLKGLWPNHSAREIGEMLGFSRNAVIGKARRLKLMEKRRPEPEPVRPPPPRVKKGKIRIQVLPARKKLPPSQPPSLGIPFGQLTNKTCRFPFGDNPPYVFCGHPEANLAADRPYCDWHTRVTARIVA